MICGQSGGSRWRSLFAFSFRQRRYQNRNVPEPVLIFEIVKVVKEPVTVRGRDLISVAGGKVRRIPAFFRSGTDSRQYSGMWDSTAGKSRPGVFGRVTGLLQYPP